MFSPLPVNVLQARKHEHKMLHWYLHQPENSITFLFGGRQRLDCDLLCNLVPYNVSRMKVNLRKERR